MYEVDEIKKDVEEFTNIAIEDRISKVQIHNVSHPIRWSCPHDLQLLIHTAMLLYNDRKHTADKT
jgi:hypothetical protein